MDVEAEIRDLKRRVGELEGSFGFLTEQIKGVHRDLLGFQARTEQRFDNIEGRLERVEGRLERVEGRLDRVEGRLGRVEGRLDRLEAEVRGLRQDLPGIVGTALREVLAEQSSKSRQS